MKEKASANFEVGGMPWTRTTLPVWGAHCLANRSGALVRLTFQMARRAEARRAKAGARGRTRTCTGDALDVIGRVQTLSALDYAGERTSAPGQDCTDTARILSPLPLLLG